MTRGPIYDNALRLLTTADLEALCRWLGIDPIPESVQLSEALPATTQHADLIARVDLARLAHVEFVRQPSRMLPLRMLDYRARIMRREPGLGLTQHVVVLAGGVVPDYFTDGSEMHLRLHVTYLRDHDPQLLLRSPALAPLAVLGRAADPADRAEVLRAAFEVVARVPEPDRRSDLTQVAAVLAAIHLDGATIEGAGREAGMPITLEGTVGGRSLEARAQARGEARGEARGSRDVLAALLRRRFGDDDRVDDVAAALVELPRDQAVDVVLAADSIEALLPYLGPAEPPG